MRVRNSQQNQKAHDCLLGLLGPHMTCTNCAIMQKAQLKEGKFCLFSTQSHLEIEIWNLVCNMWALWLCH